MRRFEQRRRVEHELRISLSVEDGARQRRYTAGGRGQRMYDHFLGVDDAIDPDCEEVRASLNDRRQAGTRYCG